MTEKAKGPRITSVPEVKGLLGMNAFYGSSKDRLRRFIRSLCVAFLRLLVCDPGEF